MKKILGVVLLVTLSLGMVSCGGGNGKAIDTNGNSGKNESVQITKPAEPTEGILIDNGGLQIIEFNIVGDSDVPGSHLEIFEGQSEASCNLTIEGGKTYLTVFLGERNTGGYDIEINEIIANEKELLISYTEIKPSEDDMVTQAFTYPKVTVELIDFDAIELEVILQNENSLDFGVETPNEEYYVSDTDSYEVGEVITIGEIFQFDGDYIHIISGDLVEVFKVDKEMSSKFYLRETVQLVKGIDADVLESFLVDDFEVKHTNMGHIIDVIKGEVVKISEEDITVLSNKEEIVISYYDHVTTQVGNMVEVHYMSFEEDALSLVSLFNDESELELTVIDIERNDFGAMTLFASDNTVEGNEVDYHVSLSQALIELNLSEIKIGDVVYVNADMILESYPAQVPATKITK